MYRVLLTCVCLTALAACDDSTSLAAPDSTSLPGTGDDIGKVVVYRDEFGVPHIYAPTVEGGLYAMGRAQAEDRPTQLLVNLKMALGEYAEVAGPDAVNHDLTHRLFDHYAAGQRSLETADAMTKRHIAAFTQGVVDHYAAHPDDLPAWWGDRPIDAAMFTAFGRYFLYNWSINEAYGDLRRAGISPGFVPRRHASNQWVVGPARSANGKALLLADPHLGWWGVTRFWEVRIHAGDLVGSGVTLAGSPYIGLGHNEHLAWSMTTGGPDTADVYTLELDPDNHARYRFDGQWRSLDTRDIEIGVRGEPTRTVTLSFSHHGPVIAWDGLGGGNPRAFAARVAYDETANPRALSLQLNFGTTVDDAITGLAELGTFPQNVMVADTRGNTYYQRAGRVPRRPTGYDWSRPVDGSTSATAWTGFHDASELVQLRNPDQGYMQNCNIPPDAMIAGGHFDPADWLPEIYSSAGYGPGRSGWINQRGARALELLTQDNSVTADDMLAWALDVKPYGVDRWLEALADILADEPLDVATSEALETVLDWDGQLERDSAGALVYAYFRFALAENRDINTRLRAAIDDWYAIVRGDEAKPVMLDAELEAALADGFRRGVATLHTHFGDSPAVYGDVFRVGRDKRSWPVGGGGGDHVGLTTLRTIGFAPPAADHTRQGYRGQTSTQVIELGTPIRSWIALPVGQSDRPESPHYTDQAETLFSPRTLKPSRWLPADLAPHVRSRTVLAYEPRGAE